MKVHVVTQEEETAGKYAISDVVVPRGGHGLSAEVLATPAGKMLERYLWYDELDLSEGLEVEICQQTTEEEGWHAIPCAFRRLIARPSDVAIHFPPPEEEEEEERETRGEEEERATRGREEDSQTSGEAGCDEAPGAASCHGHCGHAEEDAMAAAASRRRTAPPSPSSELNAAKIFVVGRFSHMPCIALIPRPNPALPLARQSSCLTSTLQVS